MAGYKPLQHIAVSSIDNTFLQNPLPSPQLLKGKIEARKWREVRALIKYFGVDTQKVKPTIEMLLKQDIQGSDNMRKTIREHTCAKCKKSKHYVEKLRACERCEKVKYCDIKSQKGDWLSSHRNECSPVVLKKEVFDKRNENEATSLINAAKYGHIDSVRRLLKNKDGFTALMLAVLKGHIDIVKLLLANDADTNLENNKGLTALMLAVAKTKDIERVNSLLQKKGVNPNLQDNEIYRDGCIAVIRRVVSLSCRAAEAVK